VECQNSTIAIGAARPGDGDERAEEIRPAIEVALKSRIAALVEAVVDANEKPTSPTN
jgi:hypothetical protein